MSLTVVFFPEETTESSLLPALLPPLHANAPRKGHVRTQQESDCVQAKKGPHLKPNCLELKSWTSTLQTCEKKFSVDGATQPMVFYDSSLNRLKHLLSPIPHFPFTFEPMSICLSTFITPPKWLYSISSLN